ncbi:hypothetical protein [Haladaptatus sp. NG-SE-30]
MHRRSYLLGTAGVLGALGSVSAALAADDENPPDDFEQGDIHQSGFVLEQGDTCVPLAIVTSNEDLSVEEFYDYRSSDTDPTGWYSAYGPATALEQPGNTILYLYDGPQGTSLVVMHSKRGAESGGAVTFNFTGLPDDGEWAVTDDQYNASTNYDNFERSNGDWSIDWTWATDPNHGGGADGGAYRGVTTDTEFRIDPAFNEEAELYGDHYEGEVKQWNALAATPEEYGWVSLDMSQPVVIRTGECDQSGLPPTVTTTETTRTTRETTRTTTESTETTRTTTETTRATTETTETTRTTTETTRTPTETTLTSTETTSTTNAPSSHSTTTDGKAAGPDGSKTTTSPGQDGLGVIAALGSVLGLGLRELVRREE